MGMTSGGAKVTPRTLEYKGHGHASQQEVFNQGIVPQYNNQRELEYVLRSNGNLGNQTTDDCLMMKVIRNLQGNVAMVHKTQYLDMYSIMQDCRCVSNV